MCIHHRIIFIKIHISFNHFFEEEELNFRKLVILMFNGAVYITAYKTMMFFGK